jgi:hypothetical protein
MVVHKFADELGLGFEPLVLGVAGGGIRFLSVRAEALWVGLLIGESVCGVVIGPLIAAFSLRGCHDASSIVRCYELINVVTMFEAPRPRYIYFFISVSEQVIYLPRYIKADRCSSRSNVSLHTSSGWYCKPRASLWLFSAATSFVNLISANDYALLFPCTYSKHSQAQADMPVYSHMVVQISTYMQVGERGLVELVGFGRLLGRSRPEVCPIAAAFRGELFKVLPHDRSAYTFL